MAKKKITSEELLKDFDEQLDREEPDALQACMKAIREQEKNPNAAMKGKFEDPEYNGED